MPTSPSNKEQELFTQLLRFKYDPLGYVLYAFPWGAKNTPLANFKAPRRWQLERFALITKAIKNNQDKMSIGLPPEAIYVAIASGRGPGKSAMLAMLNMWIASCWLGSTSIVTANTETQLKSRTMAELGKWHKMSINAHWFEKSAMSLKPSKWFANLLSEQLKIDTQYYYVEGQSWSEENPDAFAGAHSQVAMMVSFDEASGIPDAIWNVTEGFFTDLTPLRLWVVISNPRRNTGRFYECFHKDAPFWDNEYVDSRDVEGLDHSVYDRIVKKHGEDHDVTRVEVKGRFPKTNTNQFIGLNLVEDAISREVATDKSAPLLMGVDVARFGDDDSVIRFRRGRDARSILPKSYKGLDTIELADKVIMMIERFNPDAVFVDGGGVGGGVVDSLKERGYRVIEVQSGASVSAKNTGVYLNKRAEMWGEMRDWLENGCIDNNEQLSTDLTAPEYEYHTKGALKLESKESMKKRGLKSPDHGDAIALTFASKVARLDNNINRRRTLAKSKNAIIDYDVFNPRGY